MFRELLSFCQRRGHSFPFVLGTASHSCLHDSIPTARQMDFPSSAPRQNLNQLSFLDCFAATVCTVKISLLRLMGREKKKAQPDQTC